MESIQLDTLLEGFLPDALGNETKAIKTSIRQDDPETRVGAGLIGEDDEINLSTQAAAAFRIAGPTFGAESRFAGDDSRRDDGQREVPQDVVGIPGKSEKGEESGEIAGAEGSEEDVEGTAGTSGEKSTNGEQLTDDEKEQVEQMQKRDQEVRTHEQAHKAAGGQYITGGPFYDYENGPDGKRYVVSGHVNIDANPVDGDPQATIRKMEVVRRAALAPKEPSGQDRKVASQAQQEASKARQELAQEQQEELSSATGDNEGSNAGAAESGKSSGKNNREGVGGIAEPTRPGGPPQSEDDEQAATEVTADSLAEFSVDTSEPSFQTSVSSASFSPTKLGGEPVSGALLDSFA